MTGAGFPFIPETVTVHLGAPDSPAENVSVSFTDYIKNVASSEIYPTWPESAIRANILAQISFALNRIYTEYYRSRGYDFDITNSTAIDQSFVNGRDVFENISNIVDDIFNDYIVRQGSIAPLFAAYCDGYKVNCDGLSQWGSVTLAENGASPYEILTSYYGGDIGIVEDAPVMGNAGSYPGRLLRLGSAGNDVRDVQVRLNRISRNYPSIPKIPRADGIFGSETDAAVKAFQRIFSLTQDGVVGRDTWYAIARVYNAVKRISDLRSEGIPAEDVEDVFASELKRGDMGIAVRELQYLLSFISLFNDRVREVEIDGVYGAATQNALESFQQAYSFDRTSSVTPKVWDELLSVYRGILNVLPADFLPPDVALYPGFPLRIGSSGEDVRFIQEYLNYISNTFTEIPRLNTDGQFGQRTEDAVKAYQRTFGLTPNGIVGSVTWNSIVDTFLSLYQGSER
ncbi:MAG: peptidoglycan-binding protein [Clostridia bacterium]|nr:peptidoglycan-binding protein [Clostridia bacterium]